MPHLYFAYGSNMSPTTIKERAAVALLAGTALLQDHRLAFTLPSARWTGHAADILASSDSSVWGVLWKLADPNSLDEYEKRYDRVELEVLRFTQGNESGIATRAFTYTVKPEHRAAAEAPPAPPYLERMIEGGRHGNLPPDYIDFLRSCGNAEHFDAT
ncbi:MAG: gamma-glutamylcyclotransferase [bacterium]|nr:gamma-glutamylcyclotransferase [bacterium]